MRPISKIRFWRYHFMHWLFRWTVDEDYVITLTIAGFINLTKYKERTIFRLGSRFPNAPRHYQHQIVQQLNGMRTMRIDVPVGCGKSPN